jgi:hypothetical protein
LPKAKETDAIVIDETATGTVAAMEVVAVVPPAIYNATSVARGDILRAIAVPNATIDETAIEAPDAAIAATGGIDRGTALVIDRAIEIADRDRIVIGVVIGSRAVTRVVTVVAAGTGRPVAIEPINRGAIVRSAETKDKSAVLAALRIIAVQSQLPDL